jgi:hypothetical protein
VGKLSSPFQELTKPVAELGYGKDMYLLTPDEITMTMQLLYSGELIYQAVATSTKLSILYFYLRVFPFAVFPALRIAIYSTMAITVAWGVSLTVPYIFQCTPISYMWEGPTMSLLRPGSCINLSAYAWSNGALSIALDLWLMVLPFPELAKLRLEWRKKLQVIGMFALGGL